MEVEHGTGKTLFLYKQELVVHFHFSWREGRERERASGIVAATIAICFVLSAACLGHIEDNRQTALFYAARQGHVNTCNFLVYSKANVDTLDKFGETAWLGARVQTVAALFLFHCLRLASDIYWFA